ncbi:hypothetical protein M378DRAFT_16085 [Amanita muscaria Koide BX008]|uniref:Uncharacterized protein n=1 Tax=Amanita muscaria (strain Koide BX008) TaxID=946122 RepID=A0A0C2W8Z3_AMAMK|nr:hypothetical protein M378DRAFT_16085 [Amanita muscaria Koide BX008]
MGPVGLNKGKQRATSVSTREDSAPPADPVSVPEAEGGPSAAQRDHNSARPITPTPHDSQALSREASVASSPASHAPNSPPQQQVYQVHPPRVERVPITLGKRPLEGTDPETEKITLTPGELEDIIARAVASAADNGRSIAPALAAGSVVYPGGVPIGGRPWKRSKHFPAQSDRQYDPIDPNAIIVPMRVVHALEQGMLQYIPLHILTAKACREAARSSKVDKQVKHSLQLEEGSITVKPAMFDNTGESKLTALEWLDAAGRYVTLLRQHLWAGGDDAPGGLNAGQIADQWDVHFSRIRAQARFADRFTVYLEYDIRMCGTQPYSNPSLRMSSLRPPLRLLCLREPTIPFGRAKRQPSHQARGGVTRSADNRYAACSAVHMITRTASAPVVGRVSFGKMTLGSGATRKATLTALGSMALVPAHVRTLVSTYTPAPCVSVELTVLKRAQFEILFPITTRLRWTAWQETLSTLLLLPQYSDIPIGLQHGFLMGLENYQIVATSTPPNHYKLPEHDSFIHAKYDEEQALGRISPGYSPDTLRRLIGHFRTAPLNVVQHTPGGKMRVTVDHSFPRAVSPLTLVSSDHSPTACEGDYLPFDPTVQSVNAIIDSKKFQCTWGTFSQCFLLVADAPAGTEAAVFDVDAAFRNVPTHPSVRPFLAVLVGDHIHLDHCLNFGASPCPGIWGRIADAMVDIFLARGVDAVIKWLSDMMSQSSGALLSSWVGLGHRRNAPHSIPPSPTSVFFGTWWERLSVSRRRRS